jgi:hypothetical protein
MAKNASGNGIDICDGAGSWASISGGGATSAFDPNATCTVPADAGKVRFNTVSGQPEFCDGTTWRGFTLASQVANLVFTPPQQNSMNVDGGNNLDTTACTVVSGYSCGAGYPFVLQNQGGGVSGTISVSLSNSTNFVKTADTCTGQTLDPNESCSITIKPKANGNMGFTGNLQIAANNNPFALMQGVSTNFGCYPGRSGPGGIYAGCGIAAPDGTYDLVIIPGGCTGSTNNPTCTGGNDTGAVSRTYGAANINLPSVSMGASPSGAQQHQNIMAYVNMTGTVMAAAQYCDAMVYQGYSDWFLPSDTEWAYVSTAFNAGLIPFVYAAYKLSDQHSDYSYGLSKEWVSQPGSPYYRNDWRTNSQPVRCVRREALPLPSAVTDTDPDEVGIAPTVLFSASAQGTSNAVTITGIMQPITVSITGGTGMDILRNGTAMGTTTLSNVKINDTIAFRMTGPAVMGTKANATIQIGSDSYTWWVGYADSSRTAKIFVTSTTYTQGAYSGGGNGSGLGGLPGANNACSVRAGASPYGLSGSWKWVGSNTSVNAVDNIPWNWGTLKDVLGNTIVTGGITDLFDGSLALPVRYSELGTPQSTAVFTSTRTTGTKATSALDAGGALSTCNDMLGVPYYGQYVIVGNAQSSAGNWIESAWSYCNSSQYAIYCIENVDDTSDVTPAPIDLSYVVQATLSSRQLSPTVVIGGMSNGASATLSVSATGGNPKFTLNGGAEVSSATVTNGDSVVFLLDAPATASTSNKMTITANGSSTLGYWRVWSGWDGVGSGIKRIFVTSTDPNGAGFGGVAGADPVCQSRAVAAGLGGTWKAVLSGIVESEWAINRVGYNWNELRLVDGTTIAYAPNLWSTLLNPVIKTEFGATKASARVFSGTASNGRSYSAVSDLSNLYNWTGASCSATYMQGNTSALSIAITQGYWLCQSDGALYCIEQ